MKQKLFSALAALILPVALLGASLNVGDKAPDFNLQTVQGESVRLSDYVKDGRVLLVVLRGFPGYQCPVCNRQVQDFLKNAPAFADAGVRVLMVYPGPGENVKEKAQEFLMDKPFPANFTLVLDPEYRFTNQYGLRWEAKNETAYPSTFLIDKAGMVTYKKVSTTHGGRTSAAEMLDLVKR